MSGFHKNLINDGWYSEIEAMWPGQKMSLQIAKNAAGEPDIIFEGRSDFQDVIVFQSETYGRVLCLDGVIQLTERDEHAYQEMIVHLPMFSHAQPKRVLIVGGGDGGVLREIIKHDCVETVDMCEIDPMVCEVSKKYFTETMATAFNDPRLNLVHDDAAKFLKQGDLVKYDVIIVDSSDPVGPAETLFAPEFYNSMKDALNPNGVICCQGECMWLHLDLIEGVLSSCCQMFPTVEYAYTTIPTYPSGQIGFFLLSSNEKAGACINAERVPSPEMQESLKYYSAQIHPVSFVLPEFASRAVDRARVQAGRASRRS
mmetsp:Transcript_18676/g.24314  ORF Transcript_18676/g.24314 Transcript_18676/m.24314 type:complete len:314 (+) Transcript_18676:67-1008(+)